ncbi:thymidylate synthase [Candidatus Geothermarchaeota archaeon ex4572_27]|nr:MAG: thymidylate synthase [Candidatus Geothermarchaeota archaeon ex4572_27]
MRVHVVRALTLPDAWYEVLKLIEERGEEFRVERGSERARTRKVAALVYVERPELRPLIHERAPYSQSYIYQYYLEYLATGERKPDEPYTYGERLRRPVDQVRRVIERFREARGDRQCTMVLRLPQDFDLEDPPCLTVIDTEVVDEKLNFYLYFRSWDAYAGFPANMAAIQLLKEEMAAEIGVEPGFTAAFSKNLHIYEREEPLVRQVLSPPTPQRRPHWASP